MIWRTQAHYLLFYSIILIAVIFSIGCFYPLSVFEETYHSSERQNIAIALSILLSLVVILFWSTRLYQFKMHISKWRHFLSTFCIYFFCLFILFSSVSSFHYGTFINSGNLLYNYKEDHADLLENNYHLPVYFPHYHGDVIDSMDTYLERGTALSNKLFHFKKNLSLNTYGSYEDNEYYDVIPIENYELLNLIKCYIDNNHIDSIQHISEEEIRLEYGDNSEELEKYVSEKGVLSRLEFAQKEYMDDVEIGGKGYDNKLYYSISSFSAQNLYDAIEFEEARAGDLNKYPIAYSNSMTASASLFRYENYLRLRTFLASLNENQYNAYYNYLLRLDKEEQVQFFLDENVIQVHEITALFAYERIAEEYSFQKRNYIDFNPNREELHPWGNRFDTEFLIDYSTKTEQKDTVLNHLLLNFFSELDDEQQKAYKEYVHHTRILRNQINQVTELNVFDEGDTEYSDRYTTGLEDYVFHKIYSYMESRKAKINRMDSILFFNYFESGSYALKLGPTYYPMLIQKAFFDQFYNKDQANQARIADLMIKNNLVDNSITAANTNFSQDPDVVFKRQFLYHAFEKIGIKRTEASTLNVFLGFLVANLLGSFCFAILIFYFSSVKRNTILLAILINIGLLFLLTSLSDISIELLNTIAILIYFVFTMALMIIFFRAQKQIKNIKLITVTYIFYAIAVHFFMIGSQGSDTMILGVTVVDLMAMLLLVSFIVLFFFSYYFIKYIQLPLKV